MKTLTKIALLASTITLLNYNMIAQNKENKKPKVNTPLIDITIQGYEGIVKREKKEKISIQDTTLEKLIYKKNKTEEEKKTLRDYLMQKQNTVIIPGKVLAIDPIKEIIPGETYALFLDSENPSKILIYNAEDAIKILEKNKDKNLADKRILEQIKKSTYNKHLPNKIKATLEEAVNDHVLDDQETMEISKMIQNTGLSEVIVCLMNKHDGGMYKGKKVKGETVPYFLKFTGKIPIKTITKHIYVKPEVKEDIEQKIEKEETKQKIEYEKTEENDKGFLIGGLIEYDNELNKTIPGISIGYDFEQYSIIGQLGVNNNINNVRFDFQPYGYATHKQGQKFLGLMILPKIKNFEIGMGASYYIENNETHEVLKDRNLNLDKERIRNYTKNHWKANIGLGYNIEKIKINATTSLSRKQPNYRININYRI